MIRRIFQNVRRQDWTAVIIELVVVILGVFIGVQVSDWNGDLETDRKSALFTSRLKADLREEAWGYEVQVGYYEQVLRNAVAAEDALVGRNRCTMKRSSSPPTGRLSTTHTSDVERLTTSSRRPARSD